MTLDDSAWDSAGVWDLPYIAVQLGVKSGGVQNTVRGFYIGAP